MTAEEKPFSVHRGDSLLVLLAGMVLLACLYYVFAYVYLAPYPGIEHDSEWVVLGFDSACETTPEHCAVNQNKLQIGDRLVAIGKLTYEAAKRDRTLVPWAGYKPGDLVPITFLRDGVTHHIQWQVLGPTPMRRRFRLVVMLPFLPFWLAGTLILLFLRPRDTRWWLLIAFNYFTALWWAVGSASSTDVALSSLLLHALTWLMVPIFLHLHFLVPTPLLGRRGRYVLLPLYMLAVSLAGAELLQLLPNQAFYLGILLMTGGSLGLLTSRLFTKTSPSACLATYQMLAGILLAFGPGIVLWVIPSLLAVPRSGLLNFFLMAFASSLLPFFYLYALYKHRLGGLEFRANRILSLFSFLVLYLTALLVAFLFASRWAMFTPDSLGLALGISMVFVIAGLFLRAPFQRLIDRLAYGTTHNPDDILRTFTSEIPRALDRNALVRLLTQEVGPSLLIRQSAIYRVIGEDVFLLYADGVEIDEEADVTREVFQLLAESGRYRPPEPEGSKSRGPFDWVRLAIAITVRGKTLGVWLLGKRDPDDYYPRPDIELLSLLANQIGVALETSRLFENLAHRATELERAYKELQEADQLKDEFVQNISHELRTPLTFVRGYVELLLDGVLGDLEPQQREALETVADRTEGIISLVNEIISIQQQALEKIEFEPVNLVALARSCLEAIEITTRKREPDKEFEFILNAPDDIPQIWADRGRLRQVFDNLLSNAVKFSPDGGKVSIEIRSRRYTFSQDGDEDPRPAVEVIVSDQGIGIPADKRDRIWERFYQVDGSTTREYGGLGLGLAIVLDIIKAHHGAIWVESEVGKGSAFHFVLPIAPTPPASGSPDQQEENTTNATQTP
ncbi:MAG: hypothetical protein J7M34_09200 [Anaerolineae bacterium]|nr:hypothetical protein [Anaerolineae bacterium]